MLGEGVSEPGSPQPQPEARQAEEPPELTVLLGVQAVEAVGAQEDVGLPLQGLAKRVAALGDDVVEDAARGEDVHGVGLQRAAT